MIINDKDATARLNSPINLINKLRESKKNNAMQLFGIGKKDEIKKDFNPFKQEEIIPAAKPAELPPEQPEDIDTILKDNEANIKLGLAHDSAVKLLNNSITALAAKLDDVKADKLPSVISAASKTIESIRRERNEAARNNKDREVHFHFYTPEQKKINDYEVIDVSA